MSIPTKSKSRARTVATFGSDVFSKILSIKEMSSSFLKLFDFSCTVCMAWVMYFKHVLGRKNLLASIITPKRLRLFNSLSKHVEGSYVFFPCRSTINPPYRHPKLDFCYVGEKQLYCFDHSVSLRFFSQVLIKATQPRVECDFSDTWMGKLF